MGGAAFSTPIDISQGAAGEYGAQGVNLAVGPNGEVYAVWAVYDEFIFGNFTEDGIGFNKSIDGGRNWQLAKRIMNIKGIRDYWRHKNLDSASVRVNSFPSMAVDRSGGIWDGTIYVVWADSMYGDPDILLIRSTDGGNSWSNPVRVNNDPVGNGKEQWLPWISVNPYGVLHVMFFDSRNDPANVLTEAWVAESSDGGETFKNFKVSDFAFYLDPIYTTGYLSGYVGDYIGITSKEGKAYACWADNAHDGGNYKVILDIVDTYQADLLALAHSNKSLDNNATYSNSARHLAKGAGYLHEVFASGGEIFYRRSANSGQSWDVTERITTGNGDNLNACLTYTEEVSYEPPKIIHAVWERNTGPNAYQVWYACSNAEAIHWSEPVRLASVETSPWQTGAMPVITHLSGSDELVIVYASQQGLYYTFSADFGESWSTGQLIFSSSYVRYPTLSGLAGVRPLTGSPEVVSLLYDLETDREGVFSRMYD